MSSNALPYWLMMLVPHIGDGKLEDQQTGSDTLHVETRTDVQASEPTHVESTQDLVGTSNPIFSQLQDKDGDIRLRCTFLVPAPDAEGGPRSFCHLMIGSRASSTKTKVL